MVMGKVVGTVVSTRKEDELSRAQVPPRAARATPTASRPAAPSSPSTPSAPASARSCSTRRASSARQTKVTKDRPVDATIMAIVDEIEVDGDPRYQKVPSS